ncbi:ABC-F family ATP-binding cassette domain-containing protein [Candidatus Levibacter sp. Uisw_134_01]|uniref:ABC-F family ATP-binding cassette domain-containing protein n=1 Tax=Candidatus Levibacter sp. Uisw_134_01 TaxID=3230999 RepID=UPI003D48CA21
MINFKNISFSIGGVSLLEETSAFVPTGHKVGIVGRNGAGKTTLFKLIQKELIIDGGVIEIPRNFKVGSVAQEAPSTEETLLDTVLAADFERAELLRDAEIETDPNKIANIHIRLADIDAYSADARASSILTGLGFSQNDQNSPCSSFSGGWRMRVALASVLFSNPDLLLLDEPTNYLDFEGTAWLENYLQKFKNTVLVISHDRSLLNKSVNGILHLSNKKLQFYSGNYDTFDNERRIQLEQKISLKNKQDAQRAHIQSFVDRFKAKASKARQAQSRIKILEKMKPIVIEEDQKIPRFKFDEAIKFAPPLVTLDKASVGYNDVEVLKNINIQINPDDRIGLLGVNGEGKSTFSKLIAKKIKLINGSLQIPQKLKIGYFAQHQLDELRPNETAFEHVYSKLNSEIPSKVRARLGSAGFAADTMDLQVKRLSGGQKARLLLLLVVIEKPDLLILDEPTNHLDIESREALIMALNDYSGSLILVSHDAFLVERLVDRLLIVKNGGVSEFSGDIHEYRDLVLNRNQNQKKNNKKTIRINSKNNFDSTSSLSDLKKRLSISEKKINEFEKKKSDLENEMLDNQFYDIKNTLRIKEVNTDLKKNLQLLKQEEKVWEKIAEDIENFDK